MESELSRARGIKGFPKLTQGPAGELPRARGSPERVKHSDFASVPSGTCSTGGLKIQGSGPWSPCYL